MGAKVLPTYRVAFCGASGTGKTSLALWLAEELRHPFNPVGSRSVAREMGFDNPYDVDLVGQRDRFQQLLAQRKFAWEAAQRDTGFVTDRTGYDNVVYAQVHGVAPPVLTEAISYALAGWEWYTDVIFCPISSFHHVGDDTCRKTELAYHENYERRLLERLFAHAADPRGPRVTTLITKGLEERKVFLRTLFDLP